MVLLYLSRGKNLVKKLSASYKENSGKGVSGKIVYKSFIAESSELNIFLNNLRSFAILNSIELGDF